MAAILNSAILNSVILDSAILHKTLTQTNSFWLKLIHSDSTWWWQPSWILPSWIWPFCTKLCFLLSKKYSSLSLTQTHSSDSTWWWQPSWILAILDSATAILDLETLLSSLRFTQKHSYSTLSLTQTDSIWLSCWWQSSWIQPSKISQNSNSN